MTLVDLALKWINGEITDKEVKEIAQNITIYEPKDDPGGDEPTIYSIGNKNSWLEVDNLKEFKSWDQQLRFRELVLKK